MDILKKAVLLVAILSISVFTAGCGGDDAADGAGTEGDAAESGGGINLGDGLQDKIDEAEEDEAEE